jgi:hypothetical protein
MCFDLRLGGSVRRGSLRWSEGYGKKKLLLMVLGLVYRSIFKRAKMFVNNGAKFMLILLTVL